MTSEKIYVILRDKFFPNIRTFNAIYTERKKGNFKNSGICFINFYQSNYVQYLLQKSENINYFFNKNGNCKIFWADLQGDEFINEMNERKKQDISLDYILFDNNTSY